MYRLVATDLDGTVVPYDGVMSTRTISALAAVERAGARLVFVTGRPPRWMKPVADSTGHRGLAICGNGAFVYDLRAETVVQEYPLSVDDATEVVHRLRGALPDATFAAESLRGFGHEAAYRPRWDTGRQSRVAAVADLVDGPVAKLLVREESMDGDSMLAIAEPLLDGLAQVTHSNTNDCLLEVSAFGVSKASTLKRLADEWSITAEQVVAFGDMPNDVAMLRWAGAGWAVADAHPLVIDAVDNITASVDDDGVALVLERLLAQGLVGR
jgi:Cof subfamily protein (haloacid dehalogenase superfamily)